MIELLFFSALRVLRKVILACYTGSSLRRHECEI